MIKKPKTDCLAEARELEQQFPEDNYSSRDVAVQLGQTAEWVLVRRALLKLPPDLQQLFRSRKLPLTRVRKIVNSPNRRAAVEALLNRRHRRAPCPQLARRSNAEVSAMRDRMLTAGISQDSLVAQTLGWVVGTVPQSEVDATLDKLVGDGHA